MPVTTSQDKSASKSPYKRYIQNEGSAMNYDDLKKKRLEELKLEILNEKLSEEAS
jgi:hypothetical protein